MVGPETVQEQANHLERDDLRRHDYRHWWWRVDRRSQVSGEWEVRSEVRVGDDAASINGSSYWLPTQRLVTERSGKINGSYRTCERQVV